MSNGLFGEWTALKSAGLGGISDPNVVRYEDSMRALEGLTLPAHAMRRLTKEIAIEGCLGDAACGRYWPSLKSYVEHDRIRLWGLDVVDPATSKASNQSEQQRIETMNKTLNEMRKRNVVYLQQAAEGKRVDL